MKIKISTVIWFTAAILLVVTAFSEVGGDSPVWKDATYVKDAKVLPENEGKLIAISGNLETIEDAQDPLIGASFHSPFVTRTVKQLKWLNSKEEWDFKHIYEGASSDGFEDGTLTGRIKIGEFELDKKLIASFMMTDRDIDEEDFSTDNIEHMNAEGHLINEDFKCYYTTGPTKHTNLNKTDYLLNPDWDGAYYVSWKMWEPRPDDAATVVGIQQGNTLMYCDLNTSHGNDKFMDEAAFYDEATPPDITILAIIVAFICAGMGVISLIKGKRKSNK